MCCIQWPVTGENRNRALTGLSSTDFVLFLLSFILDHLSFFTFLFPFLCTLFYTATHCSMHLSFVHNCLVTSHFQLP